MSESQRPGGLGYYTVCKDLQFKLNSLARIATFMDVNKEISMMKAFIQSQFGYCSLISMFHRRVSITK